MKSSSVVGVLAVLAIAGGGIYLLTRDGAQKDTRSVVTQQGLGQNEQTWSFSIVQGIPKPGTPSLIIYGPDGPYATEDAARQAGLNWIAAHALV